MLSDTKAIILCAGKGTRMGRLGLQISKCLLKVDGQIILDRHIQLLQKNGVHDIKVIAGHLSDQMNTWLREHHPKVKPIFNELYYLDSMYSLSVGLAASTRTDNLLIISGDRMYQRQLYEKMLGHKNITCLAIGPLSENVTHRDSLTISNDRVVQTEVESVHTYGGMTYIPASFNLLINEQISKLLKSLSNPWYFALITSLINNGFEIEAIECHCDSALNINKPEHLNRGLPS